MTTASDSAGSERPSRRLMQVRRTAKVFGTTAVLGLAAAGISYASIPDSGGVIHGCYNKTSYALRVIDTAKTSACPSKTTSLNWNQTGPRGLQGLQGPQGPAGVAQGVSTTNSTSVSLAQPQTLVPVMTAPAAATSGTYYLSASIRLVVAKGDTVACIPAVNGDERGIFTTLGPVPNQTYETLPVSMAVSLNAGDTVEIECSGYTGAAATSFYDGGLTATLINSSNANAAKQAPRTPGATLPPVVR
jgi:hypothetical protein